MKPKRKRSSITNECSKDGQSSEGNVCLDPRPAEKGKKLKRKQHGVANECEEGPSEEGNPCLQSSPAEKGKKSKRKKHSAADECSDGESSVENGPQKKRTKPSSTAWDEGATWDESTAWDENRTRDVRNQDPTALMAMMEVMPWDPAVKAHVRSVLGVKGEEDEKPAARPVVRARYRRRPPQDLQGADKPVEAAPALSSKQRAAPPKVFNPGEKPLQPRKPKLAHGEMKRERWLKRKLCKLFVGRCPNDLQEQDLLDYYAPVGPDCIANIHFGRVGKGPDSPFLGYCLVRFQNAELAAKASKMRPPRIRGRQTVVSYGLLGHLTAKNTYKIADKGGRSWERLECEGRHLLPDAGWTTERMEATPFRRNFSECVKYAHRKPGELSEAMGDDHAEIQGGMIKPIITFNEVDFGDAVNQKLKNEFQAPMPIQVLSFLRIYGKCPFRKG